MRLLLEERRSLYNVQRLMVCTPAGGEMPVARVAEIIRGCTRRFRPIVLTSLTTFFGLAPIILEKSAQASFLVPMAVSLGFGILAATFIMLLIVPSC